MILIRATTQAFDRKFGEQFLRTVPICPGVYLIRDRAGTLIYVGKARNLRRRLGQYRNAKRRKKHARMRAIVADADALAFETCETDLAACLRETQLIQEHRPKWNVAGAFYFLYPLLGIRWEAGCLELCYTTEPESFPGFRFHGAFRSRLLTRDAFFALVELFGYVGHRNPRRPKEPRIHRYSYRYSFRQLPECWLEDWSTFLKGESPRAAEILVLSLIENAGARRHPGRIQEQLNAIRRFWRHEAQPLAAARKRAGFEVFPVPQRERDLLFLRSRGGRAS